MYTSSISNSSVEPYDTDTSISEESIGYDFWKTVERLRGQPSERAPRTYWNEQDDRQGIRGDTWTSADREAALQWGRKRDRQREIARQRPELMALGDTESGRSNNGSQLSLSEELSGIMDEAFRFTEVWETGRVDSGQISHREADGISSMAASLTGSLQSRGSAASEHHDDDGGSIHNVEEEESRPPFRHGYQVAGAEQYGALTSHPVDPYLGSSNSKAADTRVPTDSPANITEPISLRHTTHEPNNLSPISEKSSPPHSEAGSINGAGPSNWRAVLAQRPVGYLGYGHEDLRSYHSSLSSSATGRRSPVFDDSHLPPPEDRTRRSPIIRKPVPSRPGQQSLEAQAGQAIENANSIPAGSTRASVASLEYQLSDSDSVAGFEDSIEKTKVQKPKRSVWKRAAESRWNVGNMIHKTSESVVDGTRKKQPRRPWSGRLRPRR